LYPNLAFRIEFEMNPFHPPKLSRRPSPSPREA